MKWKKKISKVFNKREDETKNCIKMDMARQKYIHIHTQRYNINPLLERKGILYLFPCHESKVWLLPNIMNKTTMKTTKNKIFTIQKCSYDKRFPCAKPLGIIYLMMYCCIAVALNIDIRTFFFMVQFLVTFANCNFTIFLFSLFPSEIMLVFFYFLLLLYLML